VGIILNQRTIRGFDSRNEEDNDTFPKNWIFRLEC